MIGPFTMAGFTTSARSAPGPTFASLNRYKEKCFPILPLMRELHATGQLTGPPLELMQRTGPCEELYDTRTTRTKSRTSSRPPTRSTAKLWPASAQALDVWIIETGDRGATPEPDPVVAPFEKEMHDWFGTPAWAK